MSPLAMISGKLVGVPVTRPTRNGGTVCFFKLRVISQTSFEYWSCATFSETARAELEGLCEGAPVCAVGEFRVEAWERDGKHGFNLKLTADRVTTLKPKPKAKTPPAATAAAPRAERAREFDDPIPF